MAWVILCSYTMLRVTIDNSFVFWPPALCSRVVHPHLRIRTKWITIFIAVVMRGRDIDREELLKRITVDLGILVVKPTMCGMGIGVEQILDALVACVPAQELSEDYPSPEPDDFQAGLLNTRDVVPS